LPASEFRVTTDEIKAAFRESVRRHFSSQKTNDIDKCTGAEHNAVPYEIAGEHSGVFPEARQDRSGETAARGIA
jgi:hypothetical protein